VGDGRWEMRDGMWEMRDGRCESGWQWVAVGGREWGGVSGVACLIASK
jgi:hypothetical protein